MWHIILKWYFIIVTITVFSLHVHYTHHLPYGNLAICYWKWPIEIVVSHRFTYEWLWFSMANCNRLPEGVWSKNKYNSIHIHIYIYISLSLSLRRPRLMQGGARQGLVVSVCATTRTTTTAAVAAATTAVLWGVVAAFATFWERNYVVVCCFVASQKHTDSLCCGAGWPAGWLQGCKRAQAAGKSEKKYFSWISERKLSIFGCFFCSFFGNEVGFCCFGRVAKAYRLLAFGREIKFCFVVSDASQKHTAVGTKLRGGLLFRSVAKHTYSTAMLQMSRTFPVSVLWHLHLPVPGQMV